MPENPVGVKDEDVEYKDITVVNAGGLLALFKGAFKKGTEVMHSKGVLIKFNGGIDEGTWLNGESYGIHREIDPTGAIIIRFYSNG